MSNLHWTERLRREGIYANAYRIGLREGLDNLRSYLASNKFHDDTTVQVGDVFLRLDEAYTNADRAEADMREKYARMDKDA